MATGFKIIITEVVKIIMQILQILGTLFGLNPMKGH